MDGELLRHRFYSLLTTTWQCPFTDSARTVQEADQRTKQHRSKLPLIPIAWNTAEWGGDDDDNDEYNDDDNDKYNDDDDNNEYDDMRMTSMMMMTIMSMTMTSMMIMRMTSMMMMRMMTMMMIMTSMMMMTSKTMMMQQIVAIASFTRPNPTDCGQGHVQRS